MRAITEVIGRRRASAQPTYRLPGLAEDHTIPREHRCISRGVAPKILRCSPAERIAKLRTPASIIWSRATAARIDFYAAALATVSISDVCRFSFIRLSR